MSPSQAPIPIPYTSALPLTLLSKRHRTRAHYPYAAQHHLRWNDNDAFAHLNNPVYGVLTDTIVNTYLMEHCGYRPWRGIDVSSLPRQRNFDDDDTRTEDDGKQISEYAAVIASTGVDYFSSFAYPGSVEVRMRISAMGRSSVGYEVGFFQAGDPVVRAVSRSTHVFVRRLDGGGLGGVLEGGMPVVVRRGYERLIRAQMRAELEEEEGREGKREEEKKGTAKL